METADANSTTINAGTEAYVGSAGQVIAPLGTAATNQRRIGTFLGPKDTNGEVLVKLDFNGVNDHS
jgi:hypothetical protein